MECYQQAQTSCGPTPRKFNSHVHRELRVLNKNASDVMNPMIQQNISINSVNCIAVTVTNIGNALNE